MRPVPVFVVGCLTAVLAVTGTDWPQYLGPDGNGSTPERIRTNWLESPPRVLWRKSIGPGFSSVAVSGARVVTQDRRTIDGHDREVCVALNAGNGEQLWMTDLDAALYSNLSGYDDAMDGPRSTPTIDGERIYVLTSGLQLYCLGLADGKVIWHRDFPAELGSTSIGWQNAASPLLVGDLILLNANASPARLLAVRKSDGATAWRAASTDEDVLTHSTPVLANIGAVTQAIFLTRSGLVGLSPEKGGILWRFRFAPAPTSTAASPAVLGEYVYASSAYGNGTHIARVVKRGEAFDATEAGYQRGTAYQSHWATPVVHEGFLYCVPAPGSSQGRLTCLDVAAGTNRWAQGQVGTGPIGFGSVMRAAEVLVVLTESGELVLVQPSPDAYQELDRLKVLEYYCWNQVAVANGRIYARSTSAAPELVAVDVSLPSPPVPSVRLSLEPARSGAPGALRLTVRAVEGATLDASAFQKLELLSSSDLGKAGWTLLPPPSFTESNGTWTAELFPGFEPVLFLRLREKTGGQ